MADDLVTCPYNIAHTIQRRKEYFIQKKKCATSYNCCINGNVICMLPFFKLDAKFCRKCMRGYLFYCLSDITFLPVQNKVDD